MDKEKKILELYKWMKLKPISEEAFNNIEKLLDECINIAKKDECGFKGSLK